MASDKNHRPCLPLKPQEKSLLNILTKNINYVIILKTPHIGQMALSGRLSKDKRNYTITEQAVKIIFFLDKYIFF